MSFSRKKASLGVILSGIAAVVLSTTTFAWGPERATFTMESPATYATFNSITNNTSVGDERNFVRIVDHEVGGAYVNDLTLEPNKTYEVWIYFHNDASETFNDAAHNYVGVARDTRVSSNFPDSIKAGETLSVVGRITSSTTNPGAVWDEAWVTANQDLTLHYIPGTAKITGQWATDGSILSTDIFSTEGVLIGNSSLNGLILGCSAYSGHITYYFSTKAVDTPTTPPETPVTPPGTPVTPPETPSELPSTGPFEIILAVVIIMIIAAAVTYWHGTSNQMKRATRSASSRKKRTKRK